jgi:putative hydrolase of the HAD superfamily
MNLIRAVIVDFGGVLALPPSPESLERLHLASGFDEADAFLASWRQHRRPYDLGEISAQEYWRRVGSEDGHAYESGPLERLCAEDATCWAVPNAMLVTWLEALKAAGLRLALLSNMPREQWEALVNDLTWLSLCDAVVLSYRLGLAKPDPDIYRRCLEQLSLAPDEVLFVDDDPDNVVAAKELGINGVLFTSVAELRRALANDFSDLPLPPDDSLGAASART